MLGECGAQEDARRYSESALSCSLPPAWANPRGASCMIPPPRLGPPEPPPPKSPSGSRTTPLLDTSTSTAATTTCATLIRPTPASDPCCLLQTAPTPCRFGFIHRQHLVL